MSARILVIDDEPQIRRLLKTTLVARGYEVGLAEDGAAALDMAATWRPDVILLDLGLPKIDGLEVCRQVREWSHVPIIVLTVRDAEEEKVNALDAGADDYLTKPFGTDELLARIRVALRHAARAAGPAEPLLRFGNLAIDLARRRVTVREQEIHLTPTEYELLKVFIAHPNKVLTDRMLLQSVWGPGYGDQDNYLHVYVKRLRRKIEADPQAPRHLVTEPGVGYRFVVDEG